MQIFRFNCAFRCICATHPDDENCQLPRFPTLIYNPFWKQCKHPQFFTYFLSNWSAALIKSASKLLCNDGRLVNNKPVNAIKESIYYNVKGRTYTVIICIFDIFKSNLGSNYQNHRVFKRNGTQMKNFGIELDRYSPLALAPISIVLIIAQGSYPDLIITVLC